MYQKRQRKRGLTRNARLLRRKKTKHEYNFYRTTVRITKKVIRRNKRLWEKERIHTIGNNRNNNSKIFFEKVNEVKHGFKTKPTVMKKKDRTLQTESKEIVCEFKGMFEKLLNQPKRKYYHI